MQTMHPAHPRPSVAEAIERVHPRKAINDRTQRAICMAFYAGLGVLLAIGLTVGLLYSPPAGNEALPLPPATR
jgi:hypothetical protein